MTDPTLERYTNGDYAQNNPDWGSSDSPWKAKQVADMLDRHGVVPTSVVEIGCGAGGVLAALRGRLPQATMAGFDIAPGLASRWESHHALSIDFYLADYLGEDRPVPEVTLVLDVIEHLGNPFQFLAALSARANWVVFHVPLDLSAVSVLRERPLLHVRRKVGHLHYYTRGLALAMLDECGFEVIDERYTGAAYTSPQRSLKGRLASGFRRVASVCLGDLGVRLLGGETLIVLARPRGGR